MKNFLSEFAIEQITAINKSRSFSLPTFKVGDTISVKCKISEGSSVRIQSFNGIVISISKNRLNYSSTFSVRKISSGIGVEKKFLTYSPLLLGIEVLKHGVVRRAKLYYLRNRAGRSSRVREKIKFIDQENNHNAT
jgi:large subunit ribosomal protein L19